jgi:hypothetical protein
MPKSPSGQRNVEVTLFPRPPPSSRARTGKAVGAASAFGSTLSLLDLERMLMGGSVPERAKALRTLLRDGRPDAVDLALKAAETTRGSTAGVLLETAFALGCTGPVIVFTAKVAQMRSGTSGAVAARMVRDLTRKTATWAGAALLSNDAESIRIGMAVLRAELADAAPDAALTAVAIGSREAQRLVVRAHRHSQSEQLMEDVLNAVEDRSDPYPLAPLLGYIVERASAQNAQWAWRLLEQQVPPSILERNRRATLQFPSGKFEEARRSLVAMSEQPERLLRDFRTSTTEWAVKHFNSGRRLVDPKLGEVAAKIVDTVLRSTPRLKAETRATLGKLLRELRHYAHGAREPLNLLEKERFVFDVISGATPLVTASPKKTTTSSVPRVPPKLIPEAAQTWW